MPGSKHLPRYLAPPALFVDEGSPDGRLLDIREEMKGKRWSGRPPPHGVTMRQEANARGVR